MTPGAHDVEKAVSRTLRETLKALQRTAEELNQALNDLVAACGSTRATNALPPILRAQTAAASLAASLEVLSRFVASSATGPTAASGPAARDIPEEGAPIPRVGGQSVAQRPATSAPPARPEMVEDLSPVQEPALKDFAAPDADPRIDSPPARTLGQGRASDLAGQHAASFREVSREISAAPAGHASVNPIEELPAGAASFDISTLLPEEQDLHRRANRVAKVSMQDIKMLRPNDVRLGREHKDICLRLRDDIEKAHKEYDRRFQSILGHPVDYFYDWMVEILGEGDSQTLGEYPYPSPSLRR